MSVAALDGDAEMDTGEQRSLRMWWRAAWLSIGVGAVLRAWGLASQDLTFDEAFTGAAARRPLGELLHHLRTRDSHPPLDYLVRQPFATFGSEFWLRFPSLVYSIATLVVLAWWMRAKGHFGALMVVMASFSPFFLLHGREARMYAPMLLWGVLAAALADRWLARPSRALSVALGVVATLALLTHSAALVPVALLFLVPGLRRDRSAWVLRGCVVAAFVVWAALWGSAFLDQLSGGHANWIPFTSWSWIGTVLGAMVVNRVVAKGLVLVLLATGAAVLAYRRRRLAFLGALVFGLPFVVVSVLGLDRHLLLPRTFAFGAWLPLALLAALVNECRRRLSDSGAVAGLALVAVLFVPSAMEVAAQPRETHAEFDEIRRRIQPGDRIAIGPAWFAPILEWEFVGKDGLEINGVNGSGRFVVANTRSQYSGRTHVLEHAELPHDEHLFVDHSSCAPRFDASSWVLWCVEDR